MCVHLAGALDVPFRDLAFSTPFQLSNDAEIRYVHLVKILDVLFWGLDFLPSIELLLCTLVIEGYKRDFFDF